MANEIVESNPILRAAQLARKLHEGQRRKYNGRPYVEHPARVAARVSIHPAATESMVIAAWLHDVVEDAAVNPNELAASFGNSVAAIVLELTNPSKGSSAPRHERKAVDREHLAGISREAKIIKLFDRIDNLSDMAGAPADVVATYCQESKLLVDVIGGADPDLTTELLAVISAMTPAGRYERADGIAE